jgi:dipeptide transport system ATP-binding protein
MSDDVILVAKDLSKYYFIPQGTFKEPAILKALNAASFTLSRRKTLAVVGESGC